MERFRELTREHAEVTEVNGVYQRFLQRERDLAQAREMMDDPDLAEMAARGDRRARHRAARAGRRTAGPAAAADPDDVRNAFLEIRAGTGGDESALFAGDLLRMYLRYAERQGWRTEIVSESAAKSAATRKW